MKRNYPDWIQEYLKYTNHTEAPKTFHYWTAVATISGALRRRVWINMGHFKWFPNFFIFFIAPAGIVSKSTTVDIGMDLLTELDYIHIGPAVASWQALVKDLGECREEAAVGDGTFQPMSAMTIVASELGTFLDPRNQDMVNVLVSLWDGKTGAWKKITKKDGEEIIINPWISIIGCATPSWIAENFTEYFAGGGFASRTVFVYEEEKANYIAYPFRRMPDEAVMEKWGKSLTQDLEGISNLYGKFTITEEALDWGEKWYYEHFNSPHEHLQSERFKGYLARKQTHIHKLAMVLSASRRDDLIIDLAELKEAHEQVTALETDMPKIYGISNREAEMSIAADIFMKLSEKGKVSKMKLYREFIHVIKWDTYESVLRSLINSGKVAQYQTGNTMMLKVEKEISE